VLVLFSLIIVVFCEVTCVIWCNQPWVAFSHLLHTEADESSSSVAKRPRLDTQTPEERHVLCLQLQSVQYVCTLRNSITSYLESGGMAFFLLVFCIVLSLMHSLVACLKLSPHCGTDLTRNSCRWHIRIHSSPYISNVYIHLCTIHLMCGIGLFFIVTSSSSLTVQIACHLISCC